MQGRLLLLEDVLDPPSGEEGRIAPEEQPIRPNDRECLPEDAGKRQAIKFATIDSTVSLMLAFFINGAILVLAAAAFHNTVNENVADINDAYLLLSPALGASLASIMFAVALLASVNILPLATDLAASGFRYH